MLLFKSSKLLPMCESVGCTGRCEPFCTPLYTSDKFIDKTTITPTINLSYITFIRNLRKMDWKRIKAKIKQAKNIDLRSKWVVTLRWRLEDLLIFNSILQFWILHSLLSHKSFSVAKYWSFSIMTTSSSNNNNWS